MLYPALGRLEDRPGAEFHGVAVKGGAAIKGFGGDLDGAGSESQQDIVFETRDANVLLALDQFENGAAGFAEKGQVTIAGTGQTRLNGEDKPLRQQRLVNTIQVLVDEKGDMLQPQVGFTRFAA